MSGILIQALRGVCDELEKFDPNAPSLHFARGVLAAGPAAKSKIYGKWRRELEPQLHAMVTAYEDGKTLQDIAAEHGTSYMTVRRMLDSAGVVIKRKSWAKRPYRGHFMQFADAIAEKYRSGASLVAIGAEYGTSVVTIRRVLTETGIEIRPAGPGVGMKKAERVSDSYVPQIMAMRADGKTGSEIGAALGISRERVRQIVARNGLTDEFDNRPFTPEQLAALEEYRKGASIGHVAAKLGVHDVTARKWLERAGIEIRPAPKNLKIKEERERKARMIAERYLAGVNTKDIAVEFGFGAPEAIYRYLAIAGVRPTRLVNGARAPALAHQPN